MKFIHTGDLHIGKSVNGFSMLEDQKHILNQIIEAAVSNGADGCILAGDIYDRAIPTGEAVSLLDDFLTRLANAGIRVFLISGNHDSPERINFGGEIFKNHNVFVAGTYQGVLPQVTVSDVDGEVTFVMMPFVKAGYLNAATNNEAVEKMLKDLPKIQSDRRVLLTHYFVTNGGWEPELSESETTIHVGGLDNVEAGLFQGFDYVALGHIHKAQQITPSIRYAGAPLAYSFAEAGQTKSVYLVTLAEKGEVQVESIALSPLHPMRKIKGSLEELLAAGAVQSEDRKDYIQAILTDREELIDPIGSLRSVYENIMQIVLEKNLVREETADIEQRTVAAVRSKNMLDLFNEFYRIVTDEELDDERRKVAEEIVKDMEP